ncbi:MAG: hypothetical protein RR544_05190 [Oscillospiraceae bacterium]
MNRSKSVYRMAIAALLVAVGIIIPMFMPLKIVVPLMTFTLASHVAIFLAMFISPMTAVAVALGTTVGFVLSGLPPEVWMRAATQVVWAVLGAWWLQKHPDTLRQPVSSVLFCLAVALIHGVMELLVVATLYFGGFAGAAEKWNQAGFMGIILLVGVGAMVHSSVDYIVSCLIWRPIRMIKNVGEIASAN